jgi:parvulin-like peptidyl-prolyl isomerase
LERLEEHLAGLRRGRRAKYLPPDGGADARWLGRWVVQELVTHEVIAAKARDSGLIDRPDARALDREVFRQLFEHVTAAVHVPQREVWAYYRRNPDLFVRPERRRVRHVLLRHARLAHRVRARIECGEPMEELASLLSVDQGSRFLGGDLGEVQRGELAGPLERALFAAQVDDVVGPIHTEHGWHVARVETITAGGWLPFADVRATIEDQLVADARARAFGAWLERSRAELTVIEPDFEHPGHPRHGVPRHRH